MEDQKNHAAEENPALDTIARSSGKNTVPQIEKENDNSSGLCSTQSEQFSGSVSCNIVELSSDDEVQIIDVKRKSPEKNLQADDRCTSGRISPKDTTCSVCLSEYDNKAFLDKCFHAFCYFCILQWSEIVRTCPLCKSSFTSIIHSVKSMDNYQQHFLSKPDPHVLTNQQRSQSGGRRFRYRTTVTEGHRQQQQQQHQRGDTDMWEQPAGQRQTHIAAQRDRKAVGRERRRTIYRNNLWVQRVTQSGRPRQRDISPEFFRANPACTHRLIPWLTRDLRVLLNDMESHVSFVLQIILSLINKVELSSEEFSRQLQPFLFEQTDHFIHEFVGFARSPFDMTAYDERAQYNWQNDTGQELRDTPTVFHSQTSGWQTPVPGPSGESLSLTDWRGDSPALQTENNSWSPSSSPGTSGLNGRAGLETAVTIFSSNSSATSHTTQVDVELTINDEASNTVSHSNGHRNRKRSSKKTVVEVTPVVPEKKKHQHHHYHRHSHKHKHKHKHKRKEPKRSNDKSNRSKLFGDTNTVEWGSAPSFSTRPSVYSSEFCSPPPEFIVVSSDTSASPVTPTVRPGSACNNPTQFQRRKGGSRSHSNSGSRPLSQRKGGFQEDKRLRRQSGHVKPRSRDRSLSVEERVIKEHHRGRSNTSEKRLKADSERLSPSRKSGKHRREKMRKSSLRPSHSYCQRTKRGEKIQNRRTKEYARSRSSSESTSRNSRSRHSRSQKSRTRNSRSREPRSRSRGPQSSKSESRESRTRNSHSRSRDSQDSQDSRSHSQSRHFSREYTSLLSRRHHSDSRSRRSSISSAKSEPSVRELAPNSNEDALKKEIVDLESRIVADKKRLLRLLMKKEQAEAV